MNPTDITATALRHQAAQAAEALRFRINESSWPPNGQQSVLALADSLTSLGADYEPTPDHVRQDLAEKFGGSFQSYLGVTTHLSKEIMDLIGRAWEPHTTPCMHTLMGYRGAALAQAVVDQLPLNELEELMEALNMLASGRHRVLESV